MATERIEVVLAGADDRDLTKLSEYRAIGGYRALGRARSIPPAAVVEELKASELRGRGGAFFATGMKWGFVPKPEQNPNPHYLVVNADESEPGSFKDNEILSRVPHRFIEGCLITAYAIECLGGCGWATVVSVDHEYRLHVNPDDVPTMVEELRRGD